MIKCCYCHKRLGTGCFVLAGDGKSAHSTCYYRENPPYTACSIYQMARGRGDPVLAAEVISDMVPKELADDIVDEFNKRLMKNWLKNCELS